MRIPFNTNFLDGKESVMEVCDINPTQIRFNHDTKEIFVIYDRVSKYDAASLKAGSWQEVRRLVLEEGGGRVSKKKGVEYLLEIKL